MTFLPEYAYSQTTTFKKKISFFKRNLSFFKLKIEFQVNFKQIFEIFVTFSPEYAYRQTTKKKNQAFLSFLSLKFKFWPKIHDFLKKILAFFKEIKKILSLQLQRRKVFRPKFEILSTFLPEYAYSFTTFKENFSFFQRN